MKKIVLIFGGILLALFLGFVGIYIWIDIGVRNNIKTAKAKYPGNAEDALIAYLLDTTNAPEDRTHLAIWTLGQIHSEKAIPMLNGMYKIDPEGNTCRGRHDSVLCQYAIYKALNACNSKYWPLHSRLNK